ncbi:MAG TPA: hypothetical protein VK826_18385, partial [Bacteroidia bacterium]|nr:hypothetical protein [Bacteroidia bacterium]
GGTATQRSIFDTHYPRRQGAGKYHFVTSLHKHIWGITLNRAAIYSDAVPRGKQISKPTNAVSPWLFFLRRSKA